MLFLVANLVAIPLASVGLWSAVILVLSAQLPLIPQLLGKVVSRTFEWLNDFIIYIDSFTFTVWGDIHFNLWESYMMGGIVLFILVWLMRKTTAALKAALVCCILFLSAQWFSPPYVPQNESAETGKLIETSSTPTSSVEIRTSNTPLRPWFPKVNISLPTFTPQNRRNAPDSLHLHSQIFSIPGQGGWQIFLNIPLPSLCKRKFNLL